VNSSKTNLYWIECVQQIRKFYSNPIVIIDDNSNPLFVSKNVHFNNCVVLHSEFPKRGELLPYYYLHKYKWFPKAVILHDSVFVQEKIPQFESVQNARVWSFSNTHAYFHQNYDGEQKLLAMLENNEELLELHSKKSFVGMFGAMSVISLDFLEYLEEKYKFLKLIQVVSDRTKRMYFERVMGVLFSAEKIDNDMFGSIFKYCKWGLSYDEHKKNIVQPQRHLPLVKVWSGR